jgi:hypothetical protein
MPQPAANHLSHAAGQAGLDLRHLGQLSLRPEAPRLVHHHPQAVKEEAPRLHQGRLQLDAPRRLERVHVDGLHAADDFTLFAPPRNFVWREKGGQGKSYIGRWDLKTTRSRMRSCLVYAYVDSPHAPWPTSGGCSARAWSPAHRAGRGLHWPPAPAPVRRPPRSMRPRRAPCC